MTRFDPYFCVDGIPVSYSLGGKVRNKQVAETYLKKKVKHEENRKKKAEKPYRDEEKNSKTEK